MTRSITMMGTGAVAIGALFVLYALYVSDPADITPDSFGSLQRIAYAFYALVVTSLALIAYGLYRYHKATVKDHSDGLLWIIATVTWNRRSRTIFVATFVIYGVFFSLTSGTLVYQPEIIFSYHYGVPVPSVELIACCDAPGYMPKVLVYITDHVGLQIIPINLVLQITVSYLVALNVSVAASAFSVSRAKRSVSGIGAITGLFVACPTCVGSLISVLVGTASGITLGIALTQIQTLLIAVSIPVLFATPFLLARKISQSTCDT